jgi:hypothetical protein
MPAKPRSRTPAAASCAPSGSPCATATRTTPAMRATAVQVGSSRTANSETKPKTSEHHDSSSGDHHWSDVTAKGREVLRADSRGRTLPSR